MAIKLSAANRKKYNEAALELAQIKVNIKQAETRKAELDELLKSALPPGEPIDLGDVTVNIRETRTLDPAKFEKAFPVAEHSVLYKLAIDTAAVKEHIAPKDLDRYKKSSMVSLRSG